MDRVHRLRYAPPRRAFAGSRDDGGVHAGHAAPDSDRRRDRAALPRPRLGSVIGWTVVLYQALFGAVAHVWWYRAVSVIGPSRSSIFMNFQPVVGVVLATTLLKEGLTGWDVAGGALVLVGVALTTREKKTQVADRANGEARRGRSW